MLQADHTLANFLEAVFQNFYLVCSRILFPKYYLCRWSSELSQLVLLPQLRGRSPVVLIGCLIFLSASPFLDVVRMSLSTVSFLARLNSGIICLQNAVRRFTYDLNGFTSRVNGHLLSFYLCFRSNQSFCMLFIFVFFFFLVNFLCCNDC